MSVPLAIGLLRVQGHGLARLLLLYVGSDESFSAQNVGFHSTGDRDD